ncbi:MAG: hypothetical protein ACK417_08690 [Bacteroidia bacterium]
MKRLDENWLFDGLFDVEYKKYVLLDYLQFVSGNFNRNRIYPFLAEIIARHRELIQLQQRKETLLTTFPKRLKGINMQDKSIRYEPMPFMESNYMELIEEIMAMGKQIFEQGIEQGQEKYEQFERELELLPIGLLPIESSEGYLLLSTRNHPETLCYYYKLSIFEHAQDNYRSLQTRYLQTFRRSLSQTLENIKLELIKIYPQLPNPATFAALFHQWQPVQPTLLPIAKRGLVKRLVLS